MKEFAIDWQRNTYGADTLDLFYEGLNASHPEDGLTRDNSKILLVQGWGSPKDPRLAITRIQKGDDPGDVYEYIYQRHDINDIIHNPVFDQAELTEIESFTNSTELLDFIAKKFDFAFTPDDFWVSPNTIDNTGGEAQPNWLMKARYNSLCWLGELTVWLHLGP